MGSSYPKLRKNMRNYVFKLRKKDDYVSNLFVIRDSRYGQFINVINDFPNFAEVKKTTVALLIKKMFLN